jgi:hypothetical protein
MRRSLLNKQILLKSLRQALVLFTLLILPSAAWGQGTIEIAGFDATNAEVMQNNYGSTVSFNSETNTLTLNNATILGAISTSIDGLVIELIGKNTITASDGPAILSTVISNNIVLSFKSTESTVGSLTAIPKGDKAIKGFEISYGNGLSLIPEEMVEGETVVVGKDYGLKLGNIYVSNANADNIFNATNPSNNQPTASYSNGVLTLNGVTLGTIDESNLQNSDFVSIVSELDALTINLIGENKLYGTITSNLDNATLAFTGSGSLEISDASSAVSGFENVTISNGLYLKTNEPGTHWDNFNSRFNASGNAVNSITITPEVYYPIWVISSNGVDYIQVSGDNYQHVLGESDTSVTYDKDNNILLLNNYTGATTGGEFAISLGDVEEFEVHLLGVNTINGSGVGFAREVASLTFSTNEESSGKLTIGSDCSLSSIGDNYITYKNGLGYKNHVVSNEWCRIKIGSVEITNPGTTNSIGGDNSGVSFDATTNTLTLTGATITLSTSEDIDVYIKELTVEISGTNTINGRFYGHYQEDYENKGTIFFKKASNAPENTSLAISGDTDDSGPIYEFSECTWDEGLYLTEAKKGTTTLNGVYYNESRFKDATDTHVPDYVLISDQPTSVSLWIGDTPVTTANASNVFEGDENLNGKVSVTFGDTNILTLNNANLTSKGNIISSLPSLTINLTGGRSDLGENKYIISTNPSATLTFTTDGDNSLCSTIDNYAIPWKGFAGNPTFENKLVFLQAAGTMSIKVLHAPTMSYSSGSSGGLTFGGLSDGYNNTFDCYYTITYEDGDGSITNPTKYERGEVENQPNPVSMAEKPCTVTAYVTYKDRLDNTTQSETAIGKYFGIADKTIVFNNDTKGSELKASDFELIPATEGVSIAIIKAYNSNVISYNAETGATIVGIGACNIDIKINANEGSNIQILNTPTINPDTPGAQTAYIITKEVTVLPDKPSIVKDAEHDYIETDKITITRTSVEGEVAENIKIFYIWSDDEVEVKTYQPYVDGGSVSIYSEPIAAQTGTLRAWVGYHAGDNYYYNSEVVSEKFTVYKIAEMEWESETQTYGTFYNPDKDMAVPTGSTAYIVTGISEDGTSVTISPVSYIKAGVAVLIERGKTTEVSKTTDFSASKMNYSNPNTPAQPSSTDNWYVIYNNKFVKVTEGTQVKGGKCYLNLNSTPAGTRGFYNIGDGEGTTAIREVRSEGVKGEKLADGEWHDLQGRKFTTKPTKPGLYILNGKKIVIK